MWELDHKEGWAPKNWCFWTVVLEKTLESPLDCKEIQPVNSKGNKAWIFIGRTNAEAETPALWSPDAKNWLIGKDPDAGKDWSQEKKGITEDEIVGWHHRLNGYEFEQALEDGEGQGSLACCSPWSGKRLDTTELLDNNNNKLKKESIHFSSELKNTGVWNIFLSWRMTVNWVIRRSSHLWYLLPSLLPCLSVFFFFLTESVVCLPTSLSFSCLFSFSLSLLYFL